MHVGEALGKTQFSTEHWWKLAEALQFSCFHHISANQHPDPIIDAQLWFRAMRPRGMWLSASKEAQI